MIMGFRFPVFWVRGFFFGFLGEVGQSALCFLVGRSSKFLQLFAGIQSCRGNLFILIVIIIGYLPFDFLMVLNYYYHSVAIAKIVFWVAKNFRFFSLFYLVFCKWYSICSYKLGVLGPWEFFLAGRVMYMSRVCLRLWSAGLVRVYLGTVVVWTAGLYGFSFLWLCRGEYGTGEMVRGVVCFFLSFLQFAVSCLGGWISAVGTLCYIYLLVVTLWYF